MSNEADPLDDLVQQLLGAAENYRGGPESERAGAHDALGAVLHYLRAVGTKSAIRLPLEALLAALEDADAGKENRLTRPVKPTNRPPMGSKEACDLALASAAITFLKEAGNKLNYAALKVARQAPELDRDADQLIIWRKNLLRGKRRSSGSLADARNLYETVLREAVDHQPGEAADKALAMLREKLGKE